MVVGVQRRQLREHIIVRTLGLLPLHGGGAVDQSEVSIRSRDLVSTNHSSPVVPRVVDHHTAVVETDADTKFIITITIKPSNADGPEHEGVVQDPSDDCPHLPLPPRQQLLPVTTIL